MMHALTSTPREDGFRMPGEWEPPHRLLDGLARAPGQLASRRPSPRRRRSPRWPRPIATAEPVTVLASAGQSRTRGPGCPGRPGGRDVHRRRLDARHRADLRRRRPRRAARGVDWEFNAWGGLRGGLYFPWDADDRSAAKVLELERVDRYRAPLVLEGGSIHVDGEGTLLTTEECLLNPNRNPDADRERDRGHLRDHLGASTVIWLGRGVYRTRPTATSTTSPASCEPGVVVLTWCDDPTIRSTPISLDARAGSRRPPTPGAGRSRCTSLPQPGPLLMTDEEAAGVDPVAGRSAPPGGDRLAGSYVNFYIANGRVVVPLLDERRDDDAARDVAGCSPGREVVGVPARGGAARRRQHPLHHPAGAARQPLHPGFSGGVAAPSVRARARSTKRGRQREVRPNRAAASCLSEWILDPIRRSCSVLPSRSRPR